MEKIITHQLPLNQINEGMALVADGRNSIKVTLTPG
jgi:Zn-dependent alcohol dehydrogenase